MEILILIKLPENNIYCKNYSYKFDVNFNTNTGIYNNYNTCVKTNYLKIIVNIIFCIQIHSILFTFDTFIEIKKNTVK